MKKKDITDPVSYSGFIIRPADGGFDLIDPHTKRWTHIPTQRYAKWVATLMTNMAERFDSSVPMSSLPTPKGN